MRVCHREPLTTNIYARYKEGEKLSAVNHNNSIAPSPESSPRYSPSLVGPSAAFDSSKGNHRVGLIVIEWWTHQDIRGLLSLAVQYKADSSKLEEATTQSPPRRHLRSGRSARNTSTLGHEEEGQEGLSSNTHRYSQRHGGALTLMRTEAGASHHRGFGFSIAILIP
jgi:hypothetical protein